MVISSKEFQPVLADVIKFIADGKIPEPACEQFQNQQNQVADELGIEYKNNKKNIYFCFVIKNFLLHLHPKS